MVLMITERGVATWRCGWCAAVRPWQAYHDARLEAQQEIIEVTGAEEHYIRPGSRPDVDAGLPADGVVRDRRSASSEFDEHPLSCTA